MLNGFSLTNVPVWMQFTVFPPILAVTVTGFFSIGFMVFIFQWGNFLLHPLHPLFDPTLPDPSKVQNYLRF